MKVETRDRKDATIDTAAGVRDPRDRDRANMPLVGHIVIEKVNNLN